MIKDKDKEINADKDKSPLDPRKHPTPGYDEKKSNQKRYSRPSSRSKHRIILHTRSLNER